MIKELIVNFALLLAFLFGVSQLYKNEKLDFKSFGIKIKTGLFTGAFGIVLMYFSIPVDSSTFVDFRGFAILLAAHFGGFYSALIASVLIGASRVVFFGGINLSSVIGVMNILVVAGIASLIVHREKKYWSRWAKMIMVLLVTSALSLYAALGFKSLDLLPAYLGTMMVAGFFTGYMVDYIVRAHDMFLIMKEASHKDYLTGLNNHRTFDKLFNELVTSANSKEESLSLLALDIDHFKKINDTYGHPAGDAVLQQLGKLFQESTRRMDEVCRTGGEEFAVLLPECSLEQAREVAETIRTRVEKHSFILENGQHIRLTISVGTATYPLIAPDLLMEEADKALYRAKHNGRNQVC
ncbi:diguanylate cyclase [Paenibacillus sp. FJAT-26967]|uniref:diguanylate cyclase n=1 Tax=Paenibacillus sp. FJAT-26967 TaxID=1729690 RepID=UPI0009FC8D50|nr:diguanylate cyclase [Paenibacillus sp. FJAT-26967]